MFTKNHKTDLKNIVRLFVLPITILMFSTLTGNAQINSKNILIVKDGVELGSDTKLLSSIDPKDIATVNVLKSVEAQKKYGIKGKEGVIEITTKAGKTPVIAVIETQIPDPTVKGAHLTDAAVKDKK